MNSAVIAPMIITNTSGFRQLEHRRHARHHEDYERVPIGRRVDSSNRGRPYHRIGQPTCQAELRRISHRAGTNRMQIG